MEFELQSVELLADEFIDLAVQDGSVYPDYIDQNPSNPVARPADTTSGTKSLLYSSSEGDVVSCRPVACIGVSSMRLVFRIIRNPHNEDMHSWDWTISGAGSILGKGFSGSRVDDIAVVNLELNKSAFLPVQEWATWRVTITYKKWGDPLSPKVTVLVKDIPIELYVLPVSLPTYFEIQPRGKRRVPLLLLRMFVGATKSQSVTSEKDWVSLVTRICHGSAKPFTGVPASTKDHWLKYDARSGTSSFVRANNAVSAYNNYGGDFLLSAWIWAFRIWKAKNVVTLVNCYDQAGIVEVALSLGIDSRKIVWEYHKPYGFISDANNVSLVGWGPCNNPYFMGKGQTEVKMVDPYATARTYFTNHAFLVWKPEEPRPELYEDEEDKTVVPIVANSDAFAIDACAGPHLGNERRGMWEQPWAIKDGKGTTYSGMRDIVHSQNFNEQYWRTHHGLDNPNPKEQTALNHHRCSRGIVRLADDKAEQNIYLPGQDPFHDTWEKFAPPAPSDENDSPFPKNSVWSGSARKLLQEFEDNFQQWSGETQKWDPVPIADVPVQQGVTCREAKVYEPGTIRIKYYSVRITEFSKYRHARRYLMGCAAFAVLSSTGSTTDLIRVDFETLKSDKPGKGYSLKLGLQFLLCYNNVLVEINARADQEKLDKIIGVMRTKIMEPGWHISGK